MRTPINYNHTCSLLSSLDSTYHTTTYGINRRSLLNELKHYHVCDYGLPPDVMHDLLEGYLPYTLKLMLSHLITQLNLFTLDKLNQLIKNMDYGYAETSRPQCLTSESLSVSKGCATFPLSGKSINAVNLILVIISMYVATETWSLCRLLPVMIGHLIPEDQIHWKHYLDILDIVCAPTVHTNTPAHLQIFINSIVHCTFTMHVKCTLYLYIVLVSVEKSSVHTMYHHQASSYL